MTNYKPWTVKEDISLSWQSSASAMDVWNTIMDKIINQANDVKKYGPKRGKQELTRLIGVISNSMDQLQKITKLEQANNPKSFWSKNAFNRWE